MKCRLNRTMEHLPAHLGSLLPYSLTAETRVMFAEAAMIHGRRVTQPHVGENGWTSLRLRLPTNTIASQAYYARLNTDIEWDWVATPLTDAVRAEVGKIEHLYHRITRVLFLIQNPGVTLKLHRDPVPAHDYGNGPYHMAHEVLDKTPNRNHDRNRYLSIKTVVTTQHGNNGCPVLRLDGAEYGYDTGADFFSLNEVEMVHGARPCLHPRGVLWVDGYINLDAYDALPLRPIPTWRIEGETPILSPYDQPI
jgi:hypothetical protein